MTAPPVAAPNRHSESIEVGALAVWLAVQLASLWISSARWALWARAPDAVEQFAARQMLVAQLSASALLFPWMLPKICTALCVMLVSAPMLMFARTMSAEALGPALRAWVYLCAWLAGMACLARALWSERAELIAVAGVSGWVFGLLALRWQASEFLHSAPPTSRGLDWVDPIGCGLAQLQTGSIDMRTWFPALIMLAAAAAASFLTKLTGYPQR
jgi:hypothetical protein